MSDWPALLRSMEAPGTIGVAAGNSLVFDLANISGTVFTAGGVWPAANRAIYLPFMVEAAVTVYMLGFEVVTQSGNCDVGIYDAATSGRLVSAGSTAVGAAGIQTVDLTDTLLYPGVYYAAMCVDNITASFTRASAVSALWQQSVGVQQQAVGAVTLPDPATFANPASAYIPYLAVALKSTV